MVLRKIYVISPFFMFYPLLGLFTVQLPKETPGEQFEGLQMLTSLLAPKGSRSAKPFIEVLSSGNFFVTCGRKKGTKEDTEEKHCVFWIILTRMSYSLKEYCESAEQDEDEEEDEDFDWHYEQEIYRESPGEEQKYGFGNQRSGVFARLQVRLKTVAIFPTGEFNPVLSFMDTNGISCLIETDLARCEITVILDVCFFVSISTGGVRPSY